MLTRALILCWGCEVHTYTHYVGVWSVECACATICVMKLLSMAKFVNVCTLCPCIIKWCNVACRMMFNARLLIYMCLLDFCRTEDGSSRACTSSFYTWVGRYGLGSYTLLASAASMTYYGESLGKIFHSLFLELHPDKTCNMGIFQRLSYIWVHITYWKDTKKMQLILNNFQ